ncbi:MAG TPA: BON domain-containing protein [Verrucomicrobiae bacterium]|nr:BON domain-containing protein [Verrucomicrobiae bacterium]
MRYLAKSLALALLLSLVGAPAAMTADKSEKVEQVVDDAAITTAVKAKLAADKIKTLVRVSVDTVEGVVTLTGTVETANEKKQAEDIARGAKGVSKVVNNLQIANR